jgi:diacylglycerol O-acyltransferase / wax synthase
MQLMAPLDAMCLLAESREHPMHVGGLQLFTPPAGADRIKRALKADTVMAHADFGAREAYRQRMDAEVKEMQL